MIDKEVKPVSGYISSKHVFGRSLIVRGAKGFYYLKWQWHFGDESVDNIIPLTKQQYEDIKHMLLPDPVKTEVVLTDKSKAVMFKHAVSSKNYMQIKRYLIKNKILKEKDKHGYRITARS